MGKSKELLNHFREKETEKQDFLKDLNEPKSELKEFNLVLEIERMIERVQEGYEDELQAYILFTDAEKAFKSAKERILEQALSEFDNHEQKTVKMFGKSISASQSGRYTYTDSPEWDKAKKSMDDIQDSMKAALVMANKGNIAVDIDGVVIPCAKYTPSKRSLKIGK